MYGTKHSNFNISNNKVSQESKPVLLVKEGAVF